MSQPIKFTLFSIALFYSMNIFASPTLPSPEDYEKLWKQVETFDNEALPQSALNVVEEIFFLAVSENNEKQIIKAIVHRMGYTKTLVEEGAKKTIMLLENEIENYNSWVKPFLNLFLATMYMEYYNWNSFAINQRSITYGFENKDIATWDKAKFQDKIIKNYELALLDILKNEKISEFSEFIQDAAESQNCFPTLYDFMAYHIVNQIGIDGYYDGALNNNNLNNNAYLTDVETFVKLLVQGDTLSYKHSALKIFQNWLLFRLEDADNREALINTDLLRLNFVRNNLTTSDRDTMWEAATVALQKKYSNFPEIAQINWELATHYNNSGNLYNFQDSATFQYKTHKLNAIELLDDAIARFPDAKYTPACINLKKNIGETSFSFELENVVTANEKFPLRISYRNADLLYLTILKCDYEKYLNLNMQRFNNFEDNLSELSSISEKIVNSKVVTLPKATDYNKHYTEYLSDILPYGFYVILLHANKELSVENNFMAHSTFFSSDLCMITKGYDGNNSDIYILNRKTGQPVEKAEVALYLRSNGNSSQPSFKKEVTIYTDKNGLAKVSTNKNDRWSNNYRVDVSNKNDYLSHNSSFYFYSEKDVQSRTEIKFFTDRAVYRPGQTIHFKGIVLERKGDAVAIAPNYSTEVSLKDVNWKDIETLNLVSNEYGSISGSFSIPAGVLTGSFTIHTNNGFYSITVEEYKRPMFEVKLLPVADEYRLNDNVSVEGIASTYAGTALSSDTKGSFTVVRNPLLRPFFGSVSSKEIAFGNLELDDEGKFRVNFIAEVDDIELIKKYVAYNFTLNVSITDINGETQTSSIPVFVSNRALELSSSINLYMIKEQIDSVSINTRNCSGAFVPANVEIIVYKLKENKPFVAKKLWESIDLPLYSKEEWYKEYPGHEYADETAFSTFEIDKKIFQKKIDTDHIKYIKFDGIEKWNSGVYRIVLTSVDKWGNPVEFVKEFVLFSEKEKKMPANLTDFFYFDKTSAQPGDTVIIYVGSSYKDVHIFYNLGVKGKLAKTETLKLSSEIRKIVIPIDEFHRGDISVDLFFVKAGRTYKHSQIIHVEWENKKLDIQFITFRDRTLPGAAESWKLKISDYTSKPLVSELLVSMYDASLDIFAKNSWNLNLYPKYFFKINWDALSFNLVSSNYTTKNFNTEPLPLKIFNPHLILFIPYSGSVMHRKGREVMLFNSTASDALEISGISVYESEIAYNVTGQQTMDSNRASFTAPDENVQQFFPVQIRKNFSETAFFYPTLTTNEAGEILLNFTMPESLTRWNFMGFAHTKDLKTGTITKGILTQKELMVMPNLPRFFRENDKMSISAKINNVSEADISGTARIVFFDVETLKSLNFNFLNSDIPKVFNVIKDGNTVVEWEIAIPEGLSAVGVRIIADGIKHSDGEERILPVLSNKVLVTESLPLPVRRAGTSNFTLNSLAKNKSNTLRHESFTLEFTANPAWYAVQALPYLMEYPYECAEQIFSRFYANALSAHIANSNPKIQSIFELWRTFPESNALLSNLEKNEELKALLIEETPWLLDAKDETERKRRIGILFDLNRMGMESSTAIKKLSEMQQPGGAFPWFKGMPESWYITQHIISGFAHLGKLGVSEIRTNTAAWNIIQNAIPFLDKQLEKNYEELKKYCSDDCLKKDNLSFLIIHYLYVRSFFINDFPLSEATLTSFDYYKSQAEKYWTKKDFYMQGLIALALHKYGDVLIPVKIVASLKERAIHNDEMGMYWKYNSGCYWYQAPIETQALLIELFSDVANDRNSVEEMKVWLLKQKQTQDWKTTKATTEAIYALLLQGSNLLGEADFPVIKIGEMAIAPAADSEINTEAGTGYFKKRWDGSLIDSSWCNVSITKSTGSVAWGAVYWQYHEQFDKIKQYQETPLTINKQFFVERRSGDNIVIVPIENGGKLRIGDIVKVRIEIRVDRDMEYIHLKDMRAACFEPVDNSSGYRYQSGFGYYQAIKDASVNFFIDYMRKGVYVFEYGLRISQKGEFSCGITTIQTMYAPEFTSHSEGLPILFSGE